MGSSKKQTVGYWYEMGLHLGLCHGPVDEVSEIRGGDRTAWSGSITDNAQISINAPELFGGEEREGGIQGTADVMMGGPSQAANDYLAAQQGTPQPAYRGILGLVFRRGRIAANNPYIKPWAVRVRRILAGWEGGSAWYPEKAVVGLFDPLSSGQVFTENFASGVSGYDIYSGSAASFTAGFDGGSCLVFEGTTAGVVTKPIGPGLLKSVRLRFKVEAYGTDDIATFDLWDQPTTSYVLTFIPSRDYTIDALQRPSFSIRSTGVEISPDVYLGEDKVPLGEWFVFTAEYNGTTGFNVSIVNEATQEVFGSEFVTLGSPPNIVTQVFRKEVSVGSDGRVKMANVEVTLAVIDPESQAMNPAHIVYECLTNTQWGLGYPPTKIDEASFTAAADTFHAEGLGLCMQWTQQDAIQSFIQTVMDHAGAACGEDPRTGLFRLKPIRADYDIDELPVFGSSVGNTIELEGFERASLTETINELTVAYTDVSTGKTGSVTVQQLANIQAQGAVVPQSRSYPGLPTIDLAVRTALRDLRASASALARVRLSVNREGYGLQPGDVIKFVWPELGVAQMALRIGKVDYGSLTSGRIRIEAVEDVFGLPATGYISAQPIGWTEPDLTPQASQAVVAFEVPYRELLGNLGTAETAALAADAGFVAVVAARPPGASLNYEMRTRVSPSSYAQAGNGDWCPSAKLATDVGPMDLVIDVVDIVDADRFEVGSAVLLGSEVCRIDAIDEVAGTITLGRGCADTPPRAWPAGTRVWAFDLWASADPTEYSEGEVVDVKVLTRTSAGLLEEDASPAESVPLAGRAARPYAPGRLRISDELATDMAYPASAVGALTVTWAHRDRLLQQDVLADEAEASIGPELGTSYTVRIYLNGVLDHTESGISGTSSTPYTLTGNGTARVEVEAQRDGLVSWQAAVAEFAYLTSPSSARTTDAGDTRITDGGERRVKEQ
ncbi:phage tail protein [Arenimonas fontis]|uniref:Tip attachment protein J domain-containing protein n=1 Tax=Arenimonas fontis TaxID=2608255 RepID=A0A5B2ZEC7_9GAMM|nr:phage tail protein [Arenimonas fontis]KAA2285422.1 hypothetical protein F0415_05775 [Arenimonas fontis]